MSVFVAVSLLTLASNSVDANPPPDAQAIRPAFQVTDPVAGPYVLTSGFGYRTDPFTGRAAFHHGLDFASAFGTPIVAAETGAVVAAERRGPYGNMIEIDHGNGYRTRYGQLQEILVLPGSQVRRGETIATMGSTGRSTGPHLHFEVLENDVSKDPAGFVKFIVRMNPVPDNPPR